MRPRRALPGGRLRTQLGTNLRGAVLSSACPSHRSAGTRPLRAVQVNLRRMSMKYTTFAFLLHTVNMETLEGSPCLPSLLRGRYSRPILHATTTLLPMQDVLQRRLAQAKPRFSHPMVARSYGGSRAAVFCCSRPCRASNRLFRPRVCPGASQNHPHCRPRAASSSLPVRNHSRASDTRR